MRLTDFEPLRLDELAPATLASYKTKAGAAATAADAAGDVKTADKRFSGIVKATKKQFNQDAKGVSEDNLHGGNPDDEVKFFIDSEPAYYAVMDRFGDHIEFRGEDMVAPLRLWGAIQQTAGDAGGAADIAGLEDEPMWVGDELDEQGMAEGSQTVGHEILGMLRQINRQGDDAMEELYSSCPLLAQFWDQYEGDFRSMVIELSPKTLNRIKAEISAFNQQGVAEGKIKLSTEPNWYGAEVGDYRASGPVVNIPTNQLVGFEPDDKMNQPASKANVEKIVAGLKQGAKLPPLMVRQYKNGYQVLDGHHRFWAYKLLGVKSIPAQVVPAEDIEEITKQGVAEGAPIVVAQAPIDVRNPKKAPQPYRNQGDIVPDTKLPSTEKRGVKGRPGQRPMPEQGMTEDALAGMKRLAGIAPVQTPTTPGQRQYRHMPTAVQPR